MKISNYANSVSPSLARALFNMAKEYDDVIDLTLGDPDFATPEHIQNAACKAIKSGLTHYSANAGLREARVAISDHVEKNWGIRPDPDSELIVTVGGMEGLFLSLSSIVDTGDEVIIFAPYYVNYVQMVRYLGGVPVIVDAYEKEKGFRLEEMSLRNAVTDKTVAMIVNTPSNPTGAVFDEDLLRMIADIAEEHDLYILSDEVYRTLLFDGLEHKSILRYVKNRECVVLLDSLSKEFCMTGWRVGYVYGNKELVGNMVKLQENVAACAPLPSQYALIEAYTNPQDNSYVLKQFEARRDALYEAIRKIPNLYCIKPQGTFYMFVNIEKTGMTSMEFAEAFLKAEHVAVVPGETYGSGYKGYIRIAFTRDIPVLQQAAAKLARFAESL